MTAEISSVRRCGWRVMATLGAALLASCAVSPQTQAKVEEYARTIPMCSSDAECDREWALARQWTVENSAFAIRGESDTRINANSNIISQSGVGVLVNKIANGSNGSQIIVEVECFSAYGCPDLWDMQIDFNRTVNGNAQ